MNNLRSVLAWLVILATVGYHIWQWGEETLPIQTESGERSLSLDERMLLFQSRTILGSKDAMAEYLLTANPTVAQTAWQSYKQTITQIVDQIFKTAPLELGSENNRMLARDKIILALRLGENQKVDTLARALSTAKKSSYEETFDSIFLQVVNKQKALDPSLTPEESTALDEELLDFSQFLHVVSDGKSLELAPEIRNEVKLKAQNFMTGVITFACLLMLSIFFFFFYCWLFLTGRTKILYKKSGIPRHLSLETFALYMLAMLFAPKLLQFLILKGVITNIIIANVIFISGTIAILIWPVFWGHPIFTVRHAFGMYIGSFKGFIKNIFIAPTFYLASWVTFITALVLYGMLLESLHVEVEKGAHPIVPLLLSSKDDNLPFLIALLATVIAPLIEEIMFRGALYSGLRSYFGAFLAIITSALIFASVHPQGAIGMLPLTFIGIFLAFLREWRGSLVTSMIAHACINGGTLITVTLLMK